MSRASMARGDSAPVSRPQLRIVILGLSITSSWGNGHATTYRGLVRELAAAGHDVLFLERDLEWYADNRDLPRPPYGQTQLYKSLSELKARFAEEIREADLVVVGSFVPQGASVGRWVTRTARGVTAFYDIDTPVTLARLAQRNAGYITAELIPAYDLYLSFTGGPTLERLQVEYGARSARPLYCSVDPELYYPDRVAQAWDLGYMGTYSDDRQPTLDRLLIEPARRWTSGRFVVVGPQYPAEIRWPGNVERVDHLPPSKHRRFYNAQRFTLNVTRADMIRAGWSPSVRLFEAAACGTPIVSDWWPGLDTLFEPGEEILIARGPEDTLAYVRELPEEERRRIGDAARARVLADHTARHRASELERYTLNLLERRPAAATPTG
ncbi:MAG TPA: glycosyltransferase [Gemmatimonadales bacterium]|nr:glycosyltransferase [Gemmatimonadales bacterium]